jgi:hypothetical protein
MLREIEEFQDQTNHLMENMQQIDLMIERDMREQEECKVGVNEDQLKRLKLFTYIKSSKDEELCSVCLAGLKKGQKVYELACTHIFHQGCLEPWLKKSTVCPNCRRDVLLKNHLPPISATRRSIQESSQEETKEEP